jgi:EF hand
MNRSAVMRKVVLMIGAIVLISIATYVASQESATPTATPSLTSSKRITVSETSDAVFRKLDADHDGRISALEANANPKIAAQFVAADRDKDGYLSKEEFAAMSAAPMRPAVDAQTPAGDRATAPGNDRPATGPNETAAATVTDDSTPAVDPATQPEVRGHVIRPH